MIKKEFILKSLFKRFFYPGKSSAYLLFVVQTCLIWFSFYYYSKSGPASSYPYRHFDGIMVTYLMSCILFYASCIYLTFCLVIKIFPYAKIGVLGFTGIFTILIIFLGPYIPFINSDEDEFWMIMNIVYILNYRLDGFIQENILITASTTLVSCLIASFSNKRSEEKVRDFVAGERGAT